MPDVEELFSSFEQILINFALHHFLTNGLKCVPSEWESTLHTADKNITIIYK